MTKENTFSFEIIKHSDFSWSYVYIIDNKKRDLHGSSLHDLKRKVLDRGFPWDNNRFPEHKIKKSEYDSMKSTNSYKTSNCSYGDETFDYEESNTLRSWNPSLKKRKRKKDINFRYSDDDYY